MKTKGKHFKTKKGLRPTSRFYALLTTIFGITILPLIAHINDGDVTGPIFVIMIGILGYIGSFGEDK